MCSICLFTRELLVVKKKQHLNLNLTEFTTTVDINA